MVGPKTGHFLFYEDSMKIDTVLFDFDGTLADTTQPIIIAMGMMLEELGLPYKTEAERKSGIGLAMPENLKYACGVPEDKISEGERLYRKYFSENAKGNVTLYEGVREVLEQLHKQGYALGIVTSRKNDTLTEFMKDLGIYDLFGAIISVDHVINHKPHPETVFKALEILGKKPEQALVVGDATYDILMGKGAGCRTCGVSYGHQGRDTLSTVSPDYIIDSMRELLALV
jgi:HAD superfamily hydrolase (TIGR01509 family)